jgi:hypothetical protein
MRTQDAYASPCSKITTIAGMTQSLARTEYVETLHTEPNVHTVLLQATMHLYAV